VSSAEGLTDRRTEGRKKRKALRISYSLFAILQTRLIEWRIKVKKNAFSSSPKISTLKIQAMSL
jgi:hypothetical protein